MVWSGNDGAENGPPVSHVDSTSLLYVTPSNSPENSEMPAAARPHEYEHETDMPRVIELMPEQPGKITMWMDGKQLLFNFDEVAWVEVDPTMIHSTLHRIAVDAHFVAPQKNITTIKGLEAVMVRSLH